MVGIYSSHGKLVGGLNASPSLLVDTFIMHCAAMEEKDVWLLAKMKFWLMSAILRQEQFISSTDASGMDVLAWEWLMISIIGL